MLQETAPRILLSPIQKVLRVLLCRARPHSFHSMPPWFRPDLSHTMTTSLDTNPGNHLDGLQYPNTFAETSGDPPVLAYPVNLNIPEQTTHPDTDFIFSTLWTSLSIDDVFPILEYLQRYFRSGFRRVTGLRAAVVTLFNDERRWPIVEWRENNDTEVLAIFKAMGPGRPYSCLMHYGEGIAWVERKRWRRSTLTWEVSAIEDLGDLIVVAQHILGTLYWSDEDIVNLYLKDCPENCSNEQCFHT
jgi:hypothetical protein